MKHLGDSGAKKSFSLLFQMFLIACMLFLSGAVYPLWAETYYIDPINGNDSNNGTSFFTPWKTTYNINNTTFSPGDKILFKRGTTCMLPKGPGFGLNPRGSGTAGAPITMGAYGAGAKPKIYQNQNDTLIYLIDQSYWHIKDLELYGDPINPNSRDKRGIHVIASQNDVYGIVIRGLTIRDIVGLDKKFGTGSGGIKLWSRNTATVARKFHDVKIKDNILSNVHRSGIELSTSATSPEYFNVDPNKKWTGVVIRNNILSDIGGDGIVIDGTLDALVEYNVVDGAARLSSAYNAGIWARNAIGTIFQYNEVCRVRLAPGTTDGMAFDIDWYTYDTVYQYNYSHDNEGGFLLMCTNEDPSISDKTRGTVRYNISVNDGAVSKSLFTVCFLDGRNIKIYNNTFYINYGSAGNMFAFYRNPLFDTVFYNNIFYNGKADRIDFNGNKEYIQGAAFESNVYYGDFINLPFDPSMITDDPLLVQPGSTSNVDGYKLQAGSPARENGKIVADNEGKDYWGNFAPSGSPPDRGAHQFDTCRFGEEDEDEDEDEDENED